jgi:hypothetical protein
MKQTQLDYINGLKGIGAGIVYLCHFVFAFYYGMYTLEAADCHLAGNLDIVIGQSPLNTLFSGNFAVRLFLVMSGYVLCLGYFKTRDKNINLSQTMVLLLRRKILILKRDKKMSLFIQINSQFVVVRVADDDFTFAIDQHSRWYVRYFETFHHRVIPARKVR